MKADEQYLNNLKMIMDLGVHKGDRTGTGMTEIFGLTQMVFDLNRGEFPLLTTKKMFTKGIIVELLWFLNGDTNVKYLQDHGVHIWDAWADENGDLGPVYGAQWRRWPLGFSDGYDPSDAGVIDQIANLIDEIKNKPNSRRMFVSAWNPAEISDMVLPPCHTAFQCNVQPMAFHRRRWHAESQGWKRPLNIYDSREQEQKHHSRLLDEAGHPSSELHLKLYQRSADWFLGVPFNIASYSLLLMMIAKVTGLAPGRFIHTFGSAHLYDNHVEQAKEQLQRMPYQAPKMTTRTPESIDDFKLEDFVLSEYKHHPAIKAPIAV